MYTPWNDICFAYLHKTQPPYLYVFQMSMFYSYSPQSFSFHILRYLNHIKCQEEWYVLMMFWTYNFVWILRRWKLLWLDAQTPNQTKQQFISFRQNSLKNDLALLFRENVFLPLCLEGSSFKPAAVHNVIFVYNWLLLYCYTWQQWSPNMRNISLQLNWQ